MDIFSLGSLLEETKNHSGKTPIYISCMEKDYIISNILNESVFNSAFVYYEDGELIFGLDFQADNTLLLEELREMVKKEKVNSEIELILELDGPMCDEVAEFLVLPEKIILF